MSQAMSQPPVTPARRYTLAEYIALEDSSEGLFEFNNGVVIEMSGASPTHSRISSNVQGVLLRLLAGGPCEPYNMDLRIAVVRRRRYLHADASIVCGPLEYDPADKSATGVVNVRAVVEVLSPSSSAYDRTEKFEHYITMDAFDTYVIVAQDQPRVEVRTRQGNDWLLSYSTGLDAVAEIRTLGIQIPLAELYRGVKFPPVEPPAEPEQA